MLVVALSLVAPAFALPALVTEPMSTNLGASPTLVRARGAWWAYGCDDSGLRLWTSADARAWASEGPVLAPGDDVDAAGACPASVLANAGIDGHDWGAWYAAVDATGQERVALAVSDDGRSWTKLGAAYDCGGGACGSPVAMRVGRYHIWVHTEDGAEGEQLRVHHSEDGTTWSTGIAFRLPDDQTELDIAFFEGGYRVLAAGGGTVTLYEGDEVEGELRAVASLGDCFDVDGVALARDPDGIFDSTADFIGVVTGAEPRLLLGVGETDDTPCDFDPGDSDGSSCDDDCDGKDDAGDVDGGCPGCAGGGGPLRGLGAAGWGLLAALGRRPASRPAG